MKNSSFFYTTGQLVLQGDRISVGGKKAYVEKLLFPNTEDAKNFVCNETGGILLNFEDGDLQVWFRADEDLVFLGRINER